MLLVIFIGLLFGYSLVSGRLEKTVVTAPIVFTLAGFLAYLASGSMDIRMDSKAFLTLAEIGLVLLLFQLPLYASGEHLFPLVGVILLIFAPLISALIQLAVSRTREFAADDVPVICHGVEGEPLVTTLGALLPHAFGPDHLEAGK